MSILWVPGQKVTSSPPRRTFPSSYTHSALRVSVVDSVMSQVNMTDSPNPTDSTSNAPYMGTDGRVQGLAVEGRKQLTDERTCYMAKMYLIVVWLLSFWWIRKVTQVPWG